MKKPIKAWGGFSDDNLHVCIVDDQRWLAVFPTRKVAKVFYADVRRIEICEVVPPRKAKRARRTP